MLAEKNPKVGRAVAKLVELNADERARMVADAREKMRRDNASRLHSAKMEGQEEALLAVARNLLDLGRPIEEVAQVTGLSCEKIQSLPH